MSADRIVSALALGVVLASGGVPAMPGVTSAAAAVSHSDESGRIENLQTAADLIAYNQNNHVGLSVPGEGRIERSTGVISRWELPIPVHIDSSIHGTNVSEAIDYWKSTAGLSFTLVEAEAKPRLVIRAAAQQELNLATGLGLVYRTYSNNRAQLGVVKIRTDFADCTVNCAWLYRHEIGHAIGIFGHVDGGALMARAPAETEASPREINMLVQLYRLPHGARIEPDGTWKVVR